MKKSPDINKILKACPRPGNHGAPMGMCNFDDRQTDMLKYNGVALADYRVRCQRVRMVDGDYTADGTYWGAPARGESIYYVFAMRYAPCEGRGLAGHIAMLYSVRAKSRADALAQWRDDAGELRHYRVTWRIDMEASSPEEAAAKALIVQRDNDPANAATVFSVHDTRTRRSRQIDLSGEA